MKKKKHLVMKTAMLCVIVCLILADKAAKADFVFGEPVLVPNVNGDLSDGGPQISRDGLELYLNYNVVEGRCSHDIWVAKRPTINEPWSEPVKLESPVNSSGPQCTPSISADGLELYFSEGTQSVNGCAPSPQGYGNSDLWVSTRISKEDPWGTPENLGPTVNGIDSDDCPCISADGLSLYFTSDRGGYGGYDVYVTTRSSRGEPWGEPVNLGSNVNSSYYEYTAFISPDELSLFISRGWSQPKIFVCRRSTRTGPWGPAEFFTPVNSGDYLGGNPQGMGEFCISFSEEESKLYFTRGTSVHSFNFDIWQVDVSPVLDLNGDGAVNKLDLVELKENLGNTDNSLYDIAPLPLGDGIANQKDVRVLQELVLPVLADDPYPPHKANDISCNSILNWESGEFAQTHDVYLGNDFADVNDAATGDLSYLGRHEATSFDPGKLDFGKTYFWRVDEVNGAPDFTVFKGDVWRFTVEPLGIPISGITATASSANAGMEASKTIDGSGLNGLDQHAMEATDMWLSTPGPTPWIQYEFDKLYKLHEMWVWNSNQVVEAFLGLGARDVVIEYSIDGTEWVQLDDVPQFAQATGRADYTHNTTVDFGGVLARFVRITIHSGWGMLQQYGLSEVRFFYIPTQAREPQPAAGSTVDTLDVLLEWRAGREAALHQVYFSPNRAAVADGTALVGATTIPSFDLSGQGLELGSTYYWRVDEVNETASPSLYRGDVWSFNTPDYLVVDDFDQYDDNCNRIFFAWEDGLGHNGGEEIAQCDVPPSSGNGSGAIVGHNQGPFTEQTIVNEGSRQSMPFTYNDILGPSEATLTLNGQNWTTGGIQTLTLFFHGRPDNAGQLYVKINDNKVLYDGDITQEQWQQWNIDLTSISGLQNITTLTIGVEGASASGMLYIDDIRLYP